MSKYALSFTTQGNDLNTYYLAASVLGMVATKYSSSTISINSTYGFTATSTGKTFQTYIDGVFTDKYWQTNVKCYPVAKTYAPTSLSNNATKTSTSVSYSSSTSGSVSSLSISYLNNWLMGSAGNSGWTGVVSQSVPYINYKISCMSETDYKAFVDAIIQAGSLTDFEQTNTPIQA